MGLGDLTPEEDEEETEDVVEEAEVVEAETVEPEVPTPESANALLQPADNIDEVVALYKQFEEIKSELLTKGDKTKIGTNWHVNKSGWRKIATAFNLSIDIIEDKIWEEDGVVKARVKARAVAPNGKASTEVGMCASNEPRFMNSHGSKQDNKPEVEGKEVFWMEGNWRSLKSPKEVNEHDVLATAATRAKNRAISDCVGGGEVSAEEMTKEEMLGLDED